VVNGGALVLSSLAAVIIFREKLSVRRWIGVAIGTESVILLCNPFR
jgi:drug/metabolite transporter (DMT)-like permease